MPRWKTPSAVCALLITACPTTSFAQQVVKPAPPEVSILQPMAPIKIPGKVRKAAYQPLAPLVSPQQAVALNPTLQPPTGKPVARTAALDPALNPNPKPAQPDQQSEQLIDAYRQINAGYRSPDISRPAVERAASPEIIIRTPFVQPHNPNLYLFVVENVGSVDATMATVDLYVPQGVTITRVVPATATHTQQRAHIGLTNLLAGAKSIIEVEVSPTTDVVEFQTRMSLESVHKFTTAANPNYLVQSQPRIDAPRIDAPRLKMPGATVPQSTVSQSVVPKSSVFQSAVPKTTVPRTTVPEATVPQFNVVRSHIADIAPAEDAFGETQPFATAAVPAESPLTPLAPLEFEAPLAPQPTSPTARVAAAPTATVVDTTARSGKAQPPNTANAVANAANATQAKLVSATRVAAQATVDSKITATVDGPVVLDANQLADFSITVTNPNTTSAAAIIVQLQVPTGLKVTVLDRDAWFDEVNQTISWEISQLASGQQETIQYKAVGQAIGQQNQKVTIGMQNVYQGKAQLVTLVSN